MIIRILVKYSAGFREIVGFPQENLILDEGASVKELISILTSMYGEKMRSYLLDEDMKVPRSTGIWVDGRNISQTSGMGTPLSDNDVVVLAPQLLSGG